MATGRPTPNIFWGKEGVFSVLFPGMSVANVHVTGDGCLKIRSVSQSVRGARRDCDVCREPDLENSGRYTCNVVNEVGAAMSSSHVLVSEDNNTSSSHPDIYQVRLRPRSHINLTTRTNLIFSDTLMVRVR